MFHLLGWFFPPTPATLLHFIKATDSPFCHSAHSKLSSMQLGANCMWPVGKMQILPSHLSLGGSQLLLPPKQKLKFSQKSRRESFFICYKATSVWECNVCDCQLLSNYHKWQIQHRCYLIVVQKMQVTDTNCLVHLGNTVKQIRRTSDPISVSVKHLKPVPEIWSVTTTFSPTAQEAQKCTVRIVYPGLWEVGDFPRKCKQCGHHKNYRKWYWNLGFCQHGL